MTGKKREAISSSESFEQANLSDMSRQTQRVRTKSAFRSNLRTASPTWEKRTGDQKAEVVQNSEKISEFSQLSFCKERALPPQLRLFWCFRDFRKF